MKFERPLIIDVSKNDHKKYKGEVLDFSDMIDSNGVAVVLTNASVPLDTAPSIGDQYKNALRTLEECEIVGPGKDTESTGVLIANGPFIGMDDVVIREFGDGLTYGAHTWSNTNRNVNIYRCNNTVNFLGQKNSGECIRFYGCNFFNSMNAIKMHEGHMVFYGCSFDYNWNSTFNLDGTATAELHGCHIELPHARMWEFPPIFTYSDWSRFIMHGGMVWIHQPNRDAPAGSFVGGAGDSVFRDVRISNLFVNGFASGHGKCIIDNVDFRNSNVTIEKEVEVVEKIEEPWWKFWA